SLHIDGGGGGQHGDGHSRRIAGSEVEPMSMAGDQAAPGAAARKWKFRLPPLGRQVWFGLLLLAPVFTVVILPLFMQVDPLRLGTEILQPPSLSHPMGTDDLGRDVFARVMYGGRISVMVGLTSALIAAF